MSEMGSRDPQEQYFKKRGRMNAKVDRLDHMTNEEQQYRSACETTGPP
jgi:hypothetical protein